MSAAAGEGPPTARGCAIIAGVLLALVLLDVIDADWCWLALAFEVTAVLHLREPQAAR